MGERLKVDVLVVGLGPAGASAARAAARHGASVIGIDRRSEPGVPVQCAEFVPALMGEAAASVGTARRQAIHVMTTFVEEHAPHVQAGFSGTMIDRARFDAALAAEATAAGARLLFRASLERLAGDGLATLTDGRQVEARVVVGADGPRSKVGKAIRAPNRELAETRQIRVRLAAASRSTDIFLSAAYPGGYGWLFPMGLEANLGVGVAAVDRMRLRPLLAALRSRLLEEGRIGPEVLGHTGGAIPVGGIVGPVGRLGEVPVLLAGDAAGVTNPVTGAGIASAVQSGGLAGEAAARHVAGGKAQAIADYAEAVEDHFGASLRRALARRAELARAASGGRAPAPPDLERAWIAFPQYWEPIRP